MAHSRRLLVTSILFALMLIVSLLVILAGWKVTIENFVVPVYFICLIAIVSLVMSYTSFSAWRKE